MKIPYFLVLTVCVIAHNGYAEDRLPPVLDDSISIDALPIPQSPASDSSQPSVVPLPELPEPVDTKGINDVEQIKEDMLELKNKIHEQEDTINSLKTSNDELHKKVADLPKVSTALKSKKIEHISSPKPFVNSSPVVKKTKRITKSEAKPIAKLETENERYQSASTLLKQGDYTNAIAEFQGLIKNYPAGKYADNALYWIGVALTNKGDKKGAMVTFDRLARSYPKSEKVPEGLYKLGLVLLSSNDKIKAKEYFNYVIHNYPGTNAAVSAAKKKVQEKL